MEIQVEGRVKAKARPKPVEPPSSSVSSELIEKAPEKFSRPPTLITTFRSIRKPREFVEMGHSGSGGLGTIMVPGDYDHKNALAVFRKKHRDAFSLLHRRITDANFSNPADVLSRGQRLCVRAFKQVAPGATNPRECSDFLENQKALFTGAQGLSLVFDQMRSKLPGNVLYVSLVRPCRSIGGSIGHQVPHLRVYSSGSFVFNLEPLNNSWSDRECVLLCFCAEDRSLVI